MTQEIQDKLSSTLRIFSDLIESPSCIDLINELKGVKNPTFIFSGVGKNWYICEKEVKTFISMGLNAKSLDCTHALHGDLGMLMNPEEHKYVFFISKSGTTEEMVKLYDTILFLKNRGIIKNIHLILICLNPNLIENTIGFDYIIKPTVQYANIELDHRNLIPTLSIHMTQLVLDYIGVMLYENNPTLIENYKYNHMGGSNGKALGMSKYLPKAV